MPETIKAPASEPADLTALLSFTERLLEPRVLTVRGQDGQAATELLALPAGVRIEGVKAHLEPWRDRPERRAGNAQLQDLDSFIAHVNRFKDSGSALFALEDMAAPKLQAVLDYHHPTGAGEARFGKHRSVYGFPLSSEWKAWHEQDGMSMSQGEFAAFLEDRIVDVIVPPDLDDDPGLTKLAEQVGAGFAGPTRLLALARSMQISAQQTVKNAQNLSTGEISVQYEEVHGDGAGAPIKVPGLFLIVIPIFHAGQPYRLAARLRYRLAGGKIAWSYKLYRPDLSFRDAFTAAVWRARDDTALPLFMGEPEG